MKACELGEFVNGVDYPANSVIFDGWTYFRVNSNGSLSQLRPAEHTIGPLVDVPGTWQLLTPRPELGEPVDIRHFCRGEPVIVVRHGTSYFVGLCDEEGEHITFCDERGVNGLSGNQVAYKVYRDPRPLPSLPKREPTLRERLDAMKTCNDSREVMIDRVKEIPEIAALLEKSDE